jgi:hypothetical protein
MVKEQQNLYEQIIESVFLDAYKPGAERVPFRREDLAIIAEKLGVRLPKNLGDLIYSFRFRNSFPESILSRAPKGKSWIIRLVGRGRYCFVAAPFTQIRPRQDVGVTKVPDSTPGIIDMYALTDEQALLAKVRYNRLIDIFTGITCYSLQSHLRTAVEDVGQVETDEIYVGVDRRGVHYVLPVQAKGGRDKQSIVQIEQDIAICNAKFSSLVCRPVATQFMPDKVIALLAFEVQQEQIVVASEVHYQLVPPGQITTEDLEAYKARLSSV